MQYHRSILLVYLKCASNVLKVYFQLYFKCASNVLKVYFQKYAFYTPVFRRDVLWYGDVRPSVRPSVRVSVRPSVRPSQFSALFSYML